MSRNCGPAAAWMAAAILVACAVPETAAPETASTEHPWNTGAVDGTLESRIATPSGYTRIDAEPGSFGSWLRRLPLRPGRPDVRLHDGRRKLNQRAHHAVLAVDTGSRDLQQCADAVIRLRAEYLRAAECDAGIAFNFTSGDRAEWIAWRSGIRPVVQGDRVTWDRRAEPDGGYESFRRYLDTVFTYAGSASLERELHPVEDPSKIEIGDVFIRGGYPGHAVLVADVASGRNGERLFLLAQSYMPAQEIHVLRNPGGRFDPWYEARSGGELITPEWEFEYADIRRFRTAECGRENE